MRGVIVLALSALLLVACGSATGGSAPTTSVRVAYWGGPGNAPDATWELRCNPARGTVSRPARACAKLAQGGRKLFTPLMPDTICTQIYGGPQRARVVGVVAGKQVRAWFSRTDGCQIARWDALAPWLIPRGGVT